MKTEFILNINDVISTQPVSYGNFFKKGHSVIINSEEYEVIRSNLLTNGNAEVFIKKIVSKGDK